MDRWFNALLPFDLMASYRMVVSVLGLYVHVEQLMVRDDWVRISIYK